MENSYVSIELSCECKGKTVLRFGRLEATKAALLDLRNCTPYLRCSKCKSHVQFWPKDFSFDKPYSDGTGHAHRMFIDVEPIETSE